MASDVDKGDLDSLGSSAELMPADTEDEAAVRCSPHMQSLASIQIIPHMGTRWRQSSRIKFS